MYDTIGKEVSKIIQPIWLLALCENDKKKKERHLRLCNDIPAVNTMDLDSNLKSISAFYTLSSQIKSMLTTPKVMMTKHLDDTYPLLFPAQFPDFKCHSMPLQDDQRRGPLLMTRHQMINQCFVGCQPSLLQVVGQRAYTIPQLLMARVTETDSLSTPAPRLHHQQQRLLQQEQMKNKNDSN